ncbi:MAG: SDR family oxidoreductase [Prevotella sp.]|nr:SDR family oxidoreductase [Prevotellaceae bacterium]MDY3366002.1 SDR family oxidoreductase [Prevotella sp.]MDY3852690.1 SDR family oxidoreductase [Prevotella sp.]
MNKSVLITGATSGIGEACSKAFAASGYSLILTGRSQEKLNILQEQLAKNGAKVKTLTFDVRNREETAQALASLTGEWADIDILVNNAGLALGLDKLHEGDFEDWDIMIDTNIKGLLNVTRMVVPMMVERNKGHIINIGSVAGDVAYSMGNVYCATKAAVKALTDGLRIDLVNTPIKVTNVKPGLVETNFSITRFHGDEAQAKNVYQGIKPLSGEDIADTILYIANAPAHVQIAEILVLPTHQANGYTVWRNNE